MVVGMRHGIQHITEQRQALPDVQPTGIAVMVDARSLHARIKHACNVRMGEPGQDGTFTLEALRTDTADLRKVQQLDGHCAFESTIGPASPPDAPGAPLAQQRLDDVGVDLLANETCRHGLVVMDRAGQEALCPGLVRCADHRFQIASQRCVLLTQIGQPQPPVCRLEVEQRIEPRTQYLPSNEIWCGHIA